MIQDTVHNRKRPSAQAGQGFAEYALLLALVAAMAILALAATGLSVRDALGRVFQFGETEEPQPEAITVTVQDKDGNPAANIWVYAFDSDLNFRNLYQRTDSSGVTVFQDPPAGSYVFLAYVNGSSYYWAPEINFPDQSAVTIRMSSTRFMVTVVNQNGRGVRNMTVYAMTSNGRYYNGVSGKTNNNGQTTLELPVGTYTFMTYHRQSWYSSDVVDISTTSTAQITLRDTKGAVLVVDNEGNPVAGVRVYAFNPGGYYLGANGVTNKSGQLTLTVPMGNVKYRADYNASIYWSDVVIPTTSQPARIVVKK